MRRTIDCTRLDYENNSDIVKALNTQAIMEMAGSYRSNWKTAFFECIAQ